MIKAKVGASLLSFMCPPWNNKDGLLSIQKAAEAGFDLIEILLPDSRDIDVDSVKAELNKHKLDVVCGLNLSRNYHIPTHPQEAIEHIKWGVDICRALGSDYLGGVLHSAIGVFSGKPRTPEEENTLLNVWREAGHYASKYDIVIGVEPINRYESYMCTAAEETIALINKSGASNVKLHLDTFHMNIEELDFYKPIKIADKMLWHIHMTENDRGMLGEGHINWDELFKALNEINFEGRLVLENFSNSIPHMAETVSLWRPSKYTSEELASGSLAFIRKKIEQFSK